MSTPASEVNGKDDSRGKPSKNDVIDLKGEIPIDDITESDEGLLSDSDKENSTGQSPVHRGYRVDEYRYGDEGELDYDELMDTEIHAKEVEDEDEVKVHATEDIEEGEVSSDEEGEIKESDEEPNAQKDSKADKTNGDKTAKPLPPSGSQSDSQSNKVTDTTETNEQGKDENEPKSAGKKHRKKDDKMKSSGSEDGCASSSNEDRDVSSVGTKERTEKVSGNKEKRGGSDSPDKVPTPCRHFMEGKCSWGNNCRFLHKDPTMIKDRQKLPIHDRLGDGRPDFHDVPQMLPEGPRGIPRGFPPGGGPIGPGMHPRPHDGPPFMHGPGSMGMGHPHNMPLHMDPMSGPRGPMPLPPHGRPVGGFGPPHHMHGPPPFVPMHERDLPPGRPFEPMGRDPGRGSEGRMGRGPPFPPYSGGNRQKGGKTSEVTEETDGWMRLRTVTQDWSSDEEKGDRVEVDLRDKLKMKRAVGREDESDSDRERRPWGKSRSEDWADPWARDNNKEREKGGKTKNKRRKTNSSEESIDDSSSDSDKKMTRKKEKTKSRKGDKSPSGRKGRKKSGTASSDDMGSSDTEVMSSRTKKKKKIKKSSSVSSKKTKKQRDETTSSESNSEQDSQDEEDTRKKKRDAAKKRKKRSKEEESFSEEEDEGRKRKSRNKRPRLQDSISPTDDPRRYGNMRDDFYPPRSFPPHLPPEEHRRWPPHPHHPHTHSPFEDRIFPPGAPPPRDHPSHFPPETDRFGRDISKRMEYEDTRRYRRNDRPLPPPYPPSREGGFQGDYPPLHGRHGMREPPGGAGVPWDLRGRPHPFHEGHPMMKRRRSSEEVSRSPTPAANMYSNSDSSFEMERPKSSRHRDRSGQPSEGHSRRGRHGKEKSKSSRHGKSSDSEKIKHLSRKEKLLQELEAINKVIEKKKSKKRSH